MKRDFRSNAGSISKTLLVLITIAVIVLASTATVYLIQSSKTNTDACPKVTPNPYISEFCVINNLSAPNAIAVDARGNAWFIAQTEGDLGELTNSTMHLYHIPPAGKGSSSWGIVVDNSRNLVWFTDYSDNSIWSFNALNDQFTQYNLTTSSGSSFALPYQIVLDSKGDVWFTEAYINKIGELTTAGQQFQFPLPTHLASIQFSGPYGLAMENNGTLWFTDPNADSIGSLSVFSASDYTFHVYNLTNVASTPVGIAVDSQGNIWITQHGPSLISEFDPETHTLRAITTFIPPVLGYSLPYFIHIDSHGNVWFNEHYGNMIGEFIPSNSSLIEYNIPTKISSAGNISGAITMNLSPQGTPWFTEWFAGKIGRVNLQVPVNIELSFQNSSANTGMPLNLSPNSNLTLSLNAISPTGESANLTAFLSTYNDSEPFLYPLTNDLNVSAPAFLYNFSKTTGNGNFTSELTIEDQLLAPGTYYITISEITSNIHFSKVIQVQVT